MKIMLDAGHGPTTAGKRSPNGMKEFEFNEAVANLVADSLKVVKGVTLFHAHSTINDVPLNVRTDMANRLGVNCYISIHANAFGNGWNSAAGIETYVHSSKPPEASRLAQIIQDKLVKNTGLKDRGVKTANFHVLRETKMTAILVECGFMTNKTEAALLLTTEYRKKCAEAIATGLKEFYNLKSDSIQLELPLTLYHVQAGAFTNIEEAKRLEAALRTRGFESYIFSKDL